MPMDSFASLLAISALFYLLYGPIRETCTDWARQITFEKRDAIFDLAADGRLSFDTELYRIIRSSLQQNIRFAHELTFWQLVFTSARTHRDQKSKLRLAIEAIEDTDVRREVEQLVTDVYVANYEAMVFKSPLLFTVLMVIGLPALLLQDFAKYLRGLGMKASERLQVEAELLDDPLQKLAA